jgi:hypothetical protein
MPKPSGLPQKALDHIPDYVLDKLPDHLVPQPDLLTVAFTDQNGNHTYEAGTDLLIASLTDANRDGIVSVGDTIQMGTYPTSFDGSTPRGTFTIPEMSVTGVQTSLSNAIAVHTETGRVFWVHQTEDEVFLSIGLNITEYSSGSLYDGITTGEDGMFFFGPAAPGMPDTPDVVAGSQLGDQGDRCYDFYLSKPAHIARCRVALLVNANNFRTSR